MLEVAVRVARPHVVVCAVVSWAATGPGFYWRRLDMITPRGRVYASVCEDTDCAPRVRITFRSQCFCIWLYSRRFARFLT